MARSLFLRISVYFRGPWGANPGPTRGQSEFSLVLFDDAQDQEGQGNAAGRDRGAKSKHHIVVKKHGGFSSGISKPFRSWTLRFV
jgi:hypothetical protein